MSIEITIVKSPSGLQRTKLSHIFTEQGGTIGRGADNAWVLEDAEKFISSRHSEIAHEHGRYYLVDLSTNGTFFNGAAEPVGHGNRMPLKDGDRFTLGDYEFLVSVRGGGGEDPFGGGGFADLGTSHNGTIDPALSPLNRDNPFASQSGVFDSAITPILSPAISETDPLRALDKAGQFYAPTSTQLGLTEGDNSDAMQQAMQWPAAVPDSRFAIPEDWDRDEGLSAHAPARTAPDTKLQTLELRCQQLEAERQKLLKHIKALTQQVKPGSSAAAPAAHADKGAAPDATLVESIGLTQWTLPAEKKAELSRIAGAIVRETIEGLMQALTFRKKIKEEFRINVTTIQPVENNPLKFSANLDDALENMFVKTNKAYQKPLDAVREGFSSVSEHQIAVLAGMQAAFRGMVERLSPAALEQRFEKYRKSGVIKVGQNAKNWESYKAFHEELSGDMERSFQALFGYDFVQAYEEQLQRLVGARKARKGAAAKE